MTKKDERDYRSSPPRDTLQKKPEDKDKETGITSRGINPEKVTNPRTKELATDQSIAARNLIYHPNQSCLDVIERCTDGIGSIMERLSPNGDKDADLQKDKILVTMCTRLMSDGGTAPVTDFNKRLKALEDPTLTNYDELVHQLADDCRQNMLDVRTKAKIPGPEGALGRQGVLAFMGDLGGLEPKETGFGVGFPAPLTKKLKEPYDKFRASMDSLCNAERAKKGEPPADGETLNKFAQDYLQAEQAGEVFRAYTDGLCDAQRKLAGQKDPATKEELDKFAEAFLEARKVTSLKGGSLSAPAHTAGKKDERAATSFKPVERHGLHNTGDAAEEKLKVADPEHNASLRNASWPEYYVSSNLIKDVVEPVTGHVSGTFGEMAVAMNMFCGTPPATVTYDNPAGTPLSSAKEENQDVSIGALATAGLLASGFHSAVEIFQPLSTFTTGATYGSLGPAAVHDMRLQAAALRSYADKLDSDGEQSEFVYSIPKPGHPGKKLTYKLNIEELSSNKNDLLHKADSIEMAASKSTDMIALLQGHGGTLATVEISSLLANQSVDPTVPRQLFSLDTRLEALGQRGKTPELAKARTIAEEPKSEEQNHRLQLAIEAAEEAADQKYLLSKQAKEARILDARRSPPRENIVIPDDPSKVATIMERGINPEEVTNPRTKELATDQSIAARRLLYHPNQSCLDVIERCTDGIGSIMERLSPNGDKDADLQKDKILVTMCTRLMSDGGTAPVTDFNKRLKALEDPTLTNYDELVHQLADDCRQNMLDVRTKAKIPGPEGALGRQGVLAFMGDLGGLEPKETGFGAGFPAPLTKKLKEPYDKFRARMDNLCNAERGKKGAADEKTLNKFAQAYLQAEQAGEVFRAYTDGLCDAQRKLAGQKDPATKEELDKFAEAFLKARKATSLKGGSLSAPTHTAGKKVQRAATDFTPVERRGLHNTGDAAEEKLKVADPEHNASLRNASWPKYYVSRDMIKDVVEPVTGHVSGTFGEMAVAMNMFCGTPPDTVTYYHPAGTPISSANEENQDVSIGALATAGLLASGFHSAVETLQPLSTFTTAATYGSLGPAAVDYMQFQVEALRAYAETLDTDGKQPAFSYPIPKLDDPPSMKRYVLTQEELDSNQEQLLDKAASLENAESKSSDMIAMLQGEGGTLATVEISGMLANQSADPKVTRQLLSMDTRLESLGLRGDTPQLEIARRIAKEPISEEQKERLQVALRDAEEVADQRALLSKQAEEAKINVKMAKDKVNIAESMVSSLQERLESAKKALDNALSAGFKELTPEEIQEAGFTSRLDAQGQITLLEKERATIFRELKSETLNLNAAQAEATAATLTATAINTELTSADSNLIAAAKAEAVASKKEAAATYKEGLATQIEARAQEAETNSAKKIEEAQQAFQFACKAKDDALKLLRNASPEESPSAEKALDTIEKSVTALNHKIIDLIKDAQNPENSNLRRQAIVLRNKATEARSDATEARAVAKAMHDKAKDTSAIFKEAKSQLQEIAKKGGEPEDAAAKLSDPRSAGG